MFNNPDFDVSNLRQWPTWILVAAIAAFGFQYLRGFVLFVLEKLYEIFIQQNTPRL